MKRVIIDFEKYKDGCLDTATPRCDEKYCYLGFVGEVGELTNKIKKIYRGDPDFHPALLTTREALVHELGDVTWYFTMWLYRTGMLSQLGRKTFRYMPSKNFWVATDFLLATFADVHKAYQDARTTLSSGLRLKAAEKEHFRKMSVLFIIAMAKFSDSLGVSLPTVMSRNLRKLQMRKAAGTIKGSGDNR